MNDHTARRRDCGCKVHQHCGYEILGVFHPLAGFVGHDQGKLDFPGGLDRSSLPDNFVALYGNHVLELERRIQETVTYPFELLQTHFPAVVRHVQGLGCDPESPLSLLKALTPESHADSESDDIRQKSRALLNVFSKNLVFYRLDLCEATLILRAYEQFRELKQR